MSQTRSTGMDTRGHIQRGYLGNSARSANNISWLIDRDFRRDFRRRDSIPLKAKMTKERISDTADQGKATMRGVAPHRLHVLLSMLS